MKRIKNRRPMSLQGMIASMLTPVQADLTSGLMKLFLTVLVSLVATPALCWAQAGGNISYSQAGSSARAEQNERAKRTLTREELPPTDTSMFLEASVLLNVKANDYVAVFAVTQEGATVAECQQKMETVLQTFIASIKAFGIQPGDLFVDFVGQNRIYGFEVTTEVAREKQVGFELKKNVSIHFNDYALLDRLIGAASQEQIFDLIKVDYVVKNIPALHTTLMEEAARVINAKMARYQRLLGIRLSPPAQVYAEKSSLYFPSQMYDSYTAYESEDVNTGFYRQKYTVQGARKSSTFFFNALDAGSFDVVINPVVIEPVVQATLYLKVKYRIEQPGKGDARSVRRDKAAPRAKSR